MVKYLTYLKSFSIFVLKDFFMGQIKCKDNGYKLLRFWESDINNKPEDVIKILKEELI